jgi:hypothetical protein
VTQPIASSVIANGSEAIQRPSSLMKPAFLQVSQRNRWIASSLTLLAMTKRRQPRPFRHCDCRAAYAPRDFCATAPFAVTLPIASSVIASGNEAIQRTSSLMKHALLQSFSA